MSLSWGGFQLAMSPWPNRPYLCKLKRFFRTLVYRCPSIECKSKDVALQIPIEEKSDFRAMVVLDPKNILETNNFAGHYDLSKGLKDELKNLETRLKERDSTPLFVVIEYFENTDVVLDGKQCLEVDCQPEDNTEKPPILTMLKSVHTPKVPQNHINKVLASLLAEYELVGHFKKQVDFSCYENTDNRIVCTFDMEVRGELEVSSLVDVGDVRRKAEQTKSLCQKVGDNVSSENLTSCLVMKELSPTDDSYVPEMQIWYLDLWDAMEKFDGRKVKQDKYFRNETKYRIKIAHGGVEGVDTGKIKSLQKKSLEIFRAKFKSGS